jgi:CubicO group peptidase (beta-lactamase class C family)
MKILRIFFPALIFALSLSACLNDRNVKLPYRGFQPAQGNDGWITSSPTSEKMDGPLLESAFRLVYNEDRFIMARSLLVLRNGKLVAEAYPHAESDRWQIQNIQSCTKSFTSILAGIALNKKLLDSVAQPLSQILSDEFVKHPEKNDITIQDALTMRTGIAFNDGDHTMEFCQTAGSTVEFVLNLQKNYPAGVVFHYNDGTPQLISAAIERRYGRSLSSFANEFLFKPLQITEWKWEAGHDGRTFGAVSLFLTPRDAAKFGQLLLNNGTWKGSRIVDSAWIAEATRSLVTTQSPGASYGYYFWVYPSYPAYAASGHGGQYIFVCPAKNLVIVYTAWPYTSGEMFDSFTEIADLIIKSCN